MDDVQWSYGVLLWELLTRGAKPYEGIDAMRMRRHLKDGNRLAKPSPTTPDFVYAHIFFLLARCKKILYCHHTPVIGSRSAHATFPTPAPAWKNSYGRLCATPIGRAIN